MENNTNKNKGKLLTIDEVLKLKDGTKLYVENKYYDNMSYYKRKLRPLKNELILFIYDSGAILSFSDNCTESNYHGYAQINFENLRIYEWVEEDSKI